MSDPIEKQRPLLVWGTDPEAVCEAWKLLTTENVLCTLPIHGENYSVFCAYLSEAIPPALDAKLRALVSRVQVSLSRQ